MRIFITLFHLFIGVIFLILGFILLEDYWKAPSFLLMSLGIIGIVIGAGCYQNQRWVQWLIGAVMAFVSFSTLFILAGSVLMPESFAGVVILCYGIFMAVEIFSIVQLRSLTSVTVEISDMEKINPKTD